LQAPSRKNRPPSQYDHFLRFFLVSPRFQAYD